MSDPKPIGAFRTLEVRPNSILQGHVLRMRYPSARSVIASRRGELDEVDLAVEILEAIVEHDLPIEPDSMPVNYVVAIFPAWMAAMEEAALPQPQSASSPLPSAGSRSTPTRRYRSHSTTRSGRPPSD